MTTKNKKAPQKGRNNQAPISTEILVRPLHRIVNDIGSWRSALRLADLGNRSKLYDLYADLLLDGYLTDAINKRIEAVTDCDLTFTVNEKPADRVTDLIDTPEFEDFLREIMLSRFWGISVSECFLEDGFKFEFKSILRKHIRPKIKEIAVREEDERGIYYGDHTNVIQFGKDDDFGIILMAAPYVIYKRGGFGDWAQFVELFGMPQRIGKYSSMDEASRRALIQAFQEAGSAPYLVIPKESEVEQTTLSGSTNGALYNDFRQACNEEILITVLGQTMTTQDGSSLAQGKVHLAVQEKKHRADRRYVERMLNKHLVPLLVNRGYTPAGGKFHFLDKAQELSVTDTIQLSNILPIPKKYLYKKYNIPKPEEGDEIAGPAFSATPVDPEPGEDVEQDPEAAPAKIKNQDRNLFLRLWDFFVKAPAVTDRGDWTGVARIHLKDTTDFNQRLISRIVANKGASIFDAELFDYLSNDFLKAVQTPFKQILGLADFEYSAPDSAFATAVEMNLFHFSAAKTLAEVQELNQAFRESKDFQQFSEKADRITDTFNRTWQRTEYDTAVLTAESASNYQRLMSKTKLFPYWRYETAGDDQVRPEHAALDGLILPANDSRWDKIFPPNGWKCRCRVVPLMAHEVEDVDFSEMRARCDMYFETSEWKQNEAQGWDTNRGKTAEVFNKNQFYIRKFPEKAASLLGEIYYNDYGLDSFGKKLGAATQQALVFNGNVDAWYKTHKTFEDYKGRTVMLPEDTFRKHTTKKYEPVRVPLVDCIADTLKNPDEVWINNYQKAFRNFNFIKFYRDKVINVICEVREGTVYQVNTWFEIEQNPKIKDKTRRSRKIDPRWRYRRGLLIKK